ncbi:MAG: DUF169 domain-containing protein [Dehalococcoidia bacterium]|nr:DUF169 domain-containing protein [Dehalococcoidia bacterium]
MIDLKKIDEELNSCVRPATFPLAIKACRSLDEIPQKARMPKRDFGIHFPLCSGVGMARRWGWPIAMAREDIYCSGLIVLGLNRPTDFSPPDFYEQGKLCSGASYTRTDEAGARTEKATMKFDYGEYVAFVVAPLSKAAFQPDVIVVYGNPAQIMRMGVAALYLQGGSVSATLSGRLGCSQLIVRPMKTGECHFAVPGMGERMYASTQDDEMAFMIPAARIDEFMEGLRGTQTGGLRYPIPTFLRYPPLLTPVYHAFLDSAVNKES